MKELAITVAVWHTEFRTASWSKRRHKNQGVSGSGRYGTLSELKQNAVHLVVNNLLQNCTLHWQRTLPLCFSESLDLYCYFGLRIVGEAQWPSPHSGSWSSLHSGLWTHLSVKRQKDNVTGYIKGSKSECIYLTPLPPQKKPPKLLSSWFSSFNFNLKFYIHSSLPAFNNTIKTAAKGHTELVLIFSKVVLMMCNLHFFFELFFSTLNA